jgi:hypothetical protein
MFREITDPKESPACKRESRRISAGASLQKM